MNSRGVMEKKNMTHSETENCYIVHVKGKRIRCDQSQMVRADQRQRWNQSDPSRHHKWNNNEIIE